MYYKPTHTNRYLQADSYHEYYQTISLNQIGNLSHQYWGPKYTVDWFSDDMNVVKSLSESFDSRVADSLSYRASIVVTSGLVNNLCYRASTFRFICSCLCLSFSSERVHHSNSHALSNFRNCGWNDKMFYIFPSMTQFEYGKRLSLSAQSCKNFVLCVTLKCRDPLYPKLFIYIGVPKVWNSSQEDIIKHISKHLTEFKLVMCVQNGE